MRLQRLDQPRRADAFAHPGLEVGLRGAPQIQIRIQLSAQTFNVQEGFLQQNELGLHFHIEPPCGLEQAQQEVAERDILQRLLEDGFANSTYGRLKLVHWRVGRYPAGLNMQLRNLPIIPAEKGQKVSGKIALVIRCQGANDAEIDGDISGI